MNYPMYGASPNNYMQDLQNMRDRIDMQMKQMQQYQPQPQFQQTPAINQTFQLANTPSLSELDGKYVKDIEEVKNTLALKDTLFVNKEMNCLWLKRTDGSIKSFTLSEVIELDDKDRQILALQNEIEKLKGVVLNEQSSITTSDESIKSTKSTNVSTAKSNKS